MSGAHPDTTEVDELRFRIIERNGYELCASFETVFESQVLSESSTCKEVSKGADSSKLTMNVI